MPPNCNSSFFFILRYREKEVAGRANLSGDKRADYIQIQGVDGSLDLWTNKVGINPANWVEQGSVASGVGFSVDQNVHFVSFTRSGRADYIPVVPGSELLGLS